jgi:hypothetical protein
MERSQAQHRSCGVPRPCLCIKRSQGPPRASRMKAVWLSCELARKVAAPGLRKEGRHDATNTRPLAAAPMQLFLLRQRKRWKWRGVGAYSYAAHH